jgi:hypothetical protein
VLPPLLPAGHARPTPGLGPPPGPLTGVVDRRSATPLRNQRGSRRQSQWIMQQWIMQRDVCRGLLCVDRQGSRHCRACGSRRARSLGRYPGRRRCSGSPGAHRSWEPGTPRPPLCSQSGGDMLGRAKMPANVAGLSQPRAVQVGPGPADSPARGRLSPPS